MGGPHSCQSSFMNTYTCEDSLGVLAAAIDAVKGMTEIQASTLTLHFHLSLQGIIMDNLSWPHSDVGNGAEIRSETQRRLKAVYVDPILEVARMTTRAPIININHEPCKQSRESCERSRNSIPCNVILCGLGTTRAWMCGHSWIFILVQNGLPPETSSQWLPSAIVGCRWAWR